eukprot:4109853-Amphidinium_carterae.1
MNSGDGIGLLCAKESLDFHIKALARAGNRSGAEPRFAAPRHARFTTGPPTFITDRFEAF